MKFGRRDGEYEKTEHETRRGEKVRRKWRKRGRAVGTRSKLKMMCCVFVCLRGSHINPAISQVVIIFPYGCLCECVRMFVRAALTLLSLYH